MDEMFAIKCLEGESTQRVFECPFCGNKIGVADLLKPGTFRSACPWASVWSTCPSRVFPVR